jgi:spore coat polysaccharide biosynthesis protein SpsF
MVLAAVIQARMGSTRLPGKVLADVGGRPLIYHVIERASRISAVDEVVVAIPDGLRDDELMRAIVFAGARVVRGSENDVVSRYVKAAEEVRADAVVRITADCPLLSPLVSSEVVEYFLSGAQYDYVSNTLDRTFPRGLDTEVVTTAALTAANREAESHTEREHVTPFVWRRGDRFKLGSVRGQADLSSHRWTVDTDLDLQFVRVVYDTIGRWDFEMSDVLEVLDDNPGILGINSLVAQKELGL